MLQVIIGHGEPQSPPFDLDNRGKRSMVLDLRDDGDREVMLALVDTADVFVTNLRPEAVEGLGLGPDELCGRNERLVYASVTGYGRTGPDAHRAGYDVGAFWARSGIASATAPDGEAPPHLRGGLGDHVTGLATTSGVLAALLERERSGKGQVVESSLLRTGMYCLGWDLGLQMRFGKAAPSLPRAENINPMVNCYCAGDDRWFWLLGVESQRHFPALCRAIGRPEWIDDERFGSARDRRHHAGELVAHLDGIFASRTRDEWTAAFDEHDVWWAPVNTLDEAPDDPQAQAAGAIIEVPESAGAPAHRAVATPIDFSRTPARPRGGPPALGEHTAEIRTELERRSGEAATSA
jgi:crotonobetainyl-CoA:carnitine CoA-transferase CaiB-like acyl-CoA transferase